jgi:hypothetical protein
LIDDADAEAARTTLSVQPTAGPSFTAGITVTQAMASPTVVLRNTAADATDKAAQVVGAHYTATEETVQGIGIYSTATENLVAIGGGSALSNAASEVRLYTAANTTTTTGTTRLTISSTGTATFAGQIVGQAGAAITGAATFENSGNVVPLTITNAGTANSFVVNDASGDTSPFVIDAAGNVGVGISPLYKLHVSGGSAAVINGSADTYLFVGEGLSSQQYGWMRWDATNNVLGVGADTAVSVEFVTSNVPRLTISSTGTATFAGQILADDIDTANSVAYGFDSDPDTGIGRGGANVLTLVTGGVEAVTLNSGQMLLCRKGFALQGEARPSSGAGLEVNYVSASNAATIGAYDRTNNVYKELHLFGSVIDFQIGAGSDMRLDANGYLLIGYTASNGAYRLQVNSQIYATNATVATSDARFKTNVESLTDATSVIEALRPVAFDFIPQEDRNFATERQVGLIAQEAQAALAGIDYADSVVAQCGDHLGLAYEKLVPVLIKALQESNARIAALEERING